MIPPLTALQAAHSATDTVRKRCTRTQTNQTSSTSRGICPGKWFFAPDSSFPCLLQQLHRSATTTPRFYTTAKSTLCVVKRIFHTFLFFLWAFGFMHTFFGKNLDHVFRAELALRKSFGCFGKETFDRGLRRESADRESLWRLRGLALPMKSFG